MEQDIDDDDLVSLSERLLPLTSPLSSTNSTPSNEKKSTKISSNHSITFEETTPLPSSGNRGDIIQLPDGTRKKFNGSTWRRLCSKVDCFYYSQSNGLCKPHLAALNQEKSSTNEQLDSSDLHIDSFEQLSSSSTSTRKRRRVNSPLSFIPTQVPVPFNLPATQPKSTHRLSIASIPPTVDINNPKKGDIIDMENGSRKKFDGVVWRKICSIPDCFIAAQRDELCRKHFIQLNGKPVQTNFDLSGSLRTLQNASSLDDSSDMNEPIQTELTDFTDEQQGDTSIHEDEQMFSSNRQKFPTNHLKKWLRDHRDHPYPTNQEKLELAKQSSITYDQVNTWFNNARAILRRRQSKISSTFETNEPIFDDNQPNSSDTQSLIDGVYCRSIGIQCNPSTVNQTTITTDSITDDELVSDRTIRILTPSKHVLKALKSFTLERANDCSSPNEEMILTSTCLDDNQMARLKEFCQRFSVKFASNVDETTTHLITDEEESQTLVCPLSKKVIQAIARHMFILTYRWIDTCLKVNQIIDEKPFEIQGDLTLSSDHHGLNLIFVFTSYTLLFFCSVI